MAVTRSLHRARVVAGTPREVWIKIWSHLDFETLQKTCTLVSKTWFDEIRDSTNLSGKMTLKRSWNLDMRNLNAILAHWKKLKELFVASEKTSTEFGFGIDLTSHSLLRKIILTKRINLRELIGGNWATTSQVWFDPSQFWTPFTLEKVYGVEICVHHIPENYGMERIGEVMPNIETLYLLGFDLELVLSCRKLKNLDIRLRRNATININNLVSTLNLIEKVNNVPKLYVFISVDAHHLTSSQTFSIFVKSLRIIDTKFPRKSAEIEIFNVYHGYYIHKQENEAPKLTDTNDNEFLVDSDENNNN